MGDVSTAFLHASIPDDTPTYVCPPLPVRREGYVWKLSKALYGLRRSLQFFQHFTATAMAKQKFRRLAADPQVFVCDETGAVVCFHVDDLLLVCPAVSLKKVQERINKEFKMK